MPWMPFFRAEFAWRWAQSIASKLHGRFGLRGVDRHCAFMRPGTQWLEHYRRGTAFPRCERAATGAARHGEIITIDLEVPHFFGL